MGATGLASSSISGRLPVAPASAQAFQPERAVHERGGQYFFDEGFWRQSFLLVSQDSILLAPCPVLTVRVELLRRKPCLLSVFGNGTVDHIRPASRSQFSTSRLSIELANRPSEAPARR